MKEGNVLFNDALNTFYLRLYGVGHTVIWHVSLCVCVCERESVCVCVRESVCVCVRERERERDGVCVRERESVCVCV